jgi:hypothetical protein
MYRKAAQSAKKNLAMVRLKKEWPSSLACGMFLE